MEQCCWLPILSQTSSRNGWIDDDATNLVAGSFILAVIPIIFIFIIFIIVIITTAVVVLLIILIFIVVVLITAAVVVLILVILIVVVVVVVMPFVAFVHIFPALMMTDGTVTATVRAVMWVAEVAVVTAIRWSATIIAT